MYFIRVGWKPSALLIRHSLKLAIWNTSLTCINVSTLHIIGLVHAGCAQAMPFHSERRGDS